MINVKCLHDETKSFEERQRTLEIQAAELSAERFQREHEEFMRMGLGSKAPALRSLNNLWMLQLVAKLTHLIETVDCASKVVGAHCDCDADCACWR